MVSLKLACCSLLLAVGGAEASLRSRRLSYESIAGYEPGSVVTDHVSVVDPNGLCRWISCDLTYFPSAFAECS